ncbi:reverse transcriptase domain, reverse transcriptase zinc-binding domain protein [Tanacetum coccineum]
MRYIIDSSFFYSGVVPIRWNKNLPIKINIHSWRLSLNHLPTRFNLDRRGIDLNSVRCPVCDGDIEIDLHAKCDVLKRVWSERVREMERCDNVIDEMLSWVKDIEGIMEVDDCEKVLAMFKELDVGEVLSSKELGLDGGVSGQDLDVA